MHTSTCTHRHHFIKITLQRAQSCHHAIVSNYLCLICHRLRQIWHLTVIFQSLGPSGLFLAAESSWCYIKVNHDHSHSGGLGPALCVRCYVTQRNYRAWGRGTNGFHVCRKTRWRHRKTLLFMKNTWKQSNPNYLPVVPAFVFAVFSLFARSVATQRASLGLYMDGESIVHTHMQTHTYR